MSDNREDFYPPPTTITPGDYDVMCYSCDKRLAQYKVVAYRKLIASGEFLQDTRYICDSCNERELYHGSE